MSHSKLDYALKLYEKIKSRCAGNVVFDDIAKTEKYIDELITLKDHEINEEHDKVIMITIVLEAIVLHSEARDTLKRTAHAH